MLRFKTTILGGAWRSGLILSDLPHECTREEGGKIKLFVLKDARKISKEFKISFCKHLISGFHAFGVVFINNGVILYNYRSQ